MRKIAIIFIISNLMFGVDYESQIQPIFDSHCGNCHLGNSSGGLNLSNYENLMSTDVVVPGNHTSSILYDRITRDNADAGDMPPGNAELSQEQIDLIAQWIDEGALPEESSDISGCTDPNAINCDDEVDTLYFPECNTCSDNDPCENYYNPEANVDNGLCMYDDVPSEDQFFIEYFDVSIDFSSGFNLDWSDFTPPVSITQYVLQRCVDVNGDSDGDGYPEYENCVMIIDQYEPYYTQSTYTDEYDLEEGHFMKYTLYVDYPNNNFWGSAHGYYYYEESNVLLGDVNSDGIINVIDIVNLVNYILSGGGAIDTDAADFNQDGIINVIDIVNLVNFILN